MIDIESNVGFDELSGLLYIEMFSGIFTTFNFYFETFIEACFDIHQRVFCNSIIETISFKKT